MKVSLASQGNTWHQKTGRLTRLRPRTMLEGLLSLPEQPRLEPTTGTWVSLLTPTHDEHLGGLGSSVPTNTQSNIAADPIICLSSGEAVEPGWDEWQCRASGRTYPACLGIPDFRRNGGAQPAEVRTLVDAFDTSSFDELVRLRTPNFSTTNEMRAHFANYRFRMTERGKGFYDMVRKRAEAAHGPLGRERALAIGLASAPR